MTDLDVDSFHHLTMPLSICEITEHVLNEDLCFITWILFACDGLENI